MAHPKRKISKTRRDKRRTHKRKAAVQAHSICPTTGETHLPHRAFWYEDKLYYKGQVILDKTPSEANSE